VQQQITIIELKRDRFRIRIDKVNRECDGSVAVRTVPIQAPLPRSDKARLLSSVAKTRRARIAASRSAWLSAGAINPVRAGVSVPQFAEWVSPLLTEATQLIMKLSRAKHPQFQRQMSPKQKSQPVSKSAFRSTQLRKSAILTHTPFAQPH
jgi:hypothetical protein